jgi:hypothetical protein
VNARGGVSAAQRSDKAARANPFRKKGAERTKCAVPLSQWKRPSMADRIQRDAFSVGWSKLSSKAPS